MMGIVKYKKIVLCLILCMLFAGCQPFSHEQTVIEKYPSVEYEFLPIVDDLQLREGEKENICFCNEEMIIFAIGPRNGTSEGPLNKTVRLVEYDLQKRKISAQYEEDSFWTIRDAIPYQNGLAYVYYETIDKDSDFRMHWQIRYQSAMDKGEKRVLDEGICDSWWDPPRLFLLDEKAVFLYEDKDLSSGVKSIGLKKILDERIELITEYEKYNLADSLIENNGTYYIFFAENKEGNQVLMVGDQEKIYVEENTEGGLNSFSINEKVAFFSAVVEKNRFSINGSSFYCIDLQNGIVEEKIGNVRPYYRLMGSGESIICVDNGFNFYSVTPESGELQRIEIPERYCKADVTVVIGTFSLGGNRYLALFNEDYWLMQIKR